MKPSRGRQNTTPDSLKLRTTSRGTTVSRCGLSVESFVEIHGLPSSWPIDERAIGKYPRATIKRPVTKKVSKRANLPLTVALSDEAIQQVFGPLQGGPIRTPKFQHPCSESRLPATTVRKLRQWLREERARAGYVPEVVLSEFRGYSLGELLLGVRIDGTRIRAGQSRICKRQDSCERVATANY